MSSEKVNFDEFVFILTQQYAKVEHENFKVNKEIPMSTCIKKFIALLACSLAVFFSVAQADNATIIPQAPNLNAKSYILVDARTGAVLAAKNPDQKVAPASLTKLMTLYIVFTQLSKGTIHLTDPVRISKKAWQTGGSRMFLREGSTPTVEQLIQGVIVDSGNDACVALSQFVAGSEDAFVSMMNTEAKQLGMTNTHFMDATGLPNPQHYTTARSLAVLSRAIIQDFPQYYHYFSQKWFEYNNIKQPNRNRLLWRYKYADGMKTGHTSEAGYCLIGSAQKDGMRLISVVLNTPSDEARADDSQALLTYGFRFFKTYRLYRANETIETPRVYFGETNKVPVGLNQPLYITVPVGSEKSIKTSKQLQSPLKAPLKYSQAVGNLTITLNGKSLAVAHLATLKAVKMGGFFGRMGDHVSLGFSHFFGGKKK